jgi:hypothetical protein
VGDFTTLATLQLAHTTGPNENGAFFVVVESDSSNADSWPYAVTLSEQPVAAVCASGGDAGEPNEDAASATDLATDELHILSRCGDDVDYAHFLVPANFVFSVEVRQDPRYGVLSIALLDESSNVLAYRDDGDELTTLGHLASAPLDLYVRVALDAPTDEPAQEYSVFPRVTPGD